jgi:hypothetical protein
VPDCIFEHRKAVSIENETLRVTVLPGGGHIAEVLHKQRGVNPLWVPHWQSIEPSRYDPVQHHKFGTGSDARLLASIMGHNLCLDLFGGPSAEEEAAGVTAHGEGSLGDYTITEHPNYLDMQLILPLAQLSITRSIQLQGNYVRIRETIENLAAFDRPIAWTQHVTLSPPFLDPATTQFRSSMDKSIVSESDPGSDGYLRKGVEFTWPNAPREDGRTADLQQMNPATPASGYTTHLSNPSNQNAHFLAFSPKYKLAFGYLWKREDFPWLGIWEENCSRQASPWNGRTITRGMEFGVSPFPESRREMVDRGRLLGAPTYRWLPCKGLLEAEYWIYCNTADSIPQSFPVPDTIAS